MGGGRLDKDGGRGEWVQCPGQAFNTGERNETRGPKKNRNGWPQTLSIFLFPPSSHKRKHTSWDRRAPTITTNTCGYHSQFKSIKIIWMHWQHGRNYFSSTPKYHIVFQPYAAVLPFLSLWGRYSDITLTCLGLREKTNQELTKKNYIALISAINPNDSK